MHAQLSVAVSQARALLGYTPSEEIVVTAARSVRPRDPVDEVVRAIAFFAVRNERNVRRMMQRPACAPLTQGTTPR
jgi:hypothetical protein